MRNIDQSVESNLTNESVCMGFSITMHLILLLLNPGILKSDFHPAHDFVTVDVVEQPAPGGSVEAEAPKKMSLLDTLKDMITKPKAEEIAHIAPTEPVAQRVAAPLQPLLQEANRPRPVATTFEPHSQAEDLATANAPNTINTARTLPTLPIGSPAMTSKSYSGGIKARDLPFQVSGEGISGGDNVVPIAVGNNSAKTALAYGGPTLQDAKNHHVGIQPVGTGSTAGNLNTLGAGSADSIPLSGTGGTGNAPTGATSGNVLQDRAGSGSGLVNRAMFGSGRGSGVGSGIEGMPSAAQELDAQLGSGSGSGKGGKQVKKGFEISGPLNNRTIVHKMIPQYPAWAEEQGIIGSVRLYFTVTPEGTVRPNIRVTKTTGYPQLDQLGIDALKQWQFAPLSSSDEDRGEWGIITFNFSLSS